MSNNDNIGYIERDLLIQIANSVRNKTGKSEQIEVEDLPQEIDNIEGDSTIINELDQVNQSIVEQSNRLEQCFDEDFPGGDELYNEIYNGAYEAGKKAEYDRFWDNFQNYGNRNVYTQAFMQNSWNDETFKPKYPFICGTTNAASYMFYNNTTTLTAIDMPIILQNDCKFSEVFNSCLILKRISSLTFNENTAFTNGFIRCIALEELNIKGIIAQSGFDTSWCKNLNKTSIMSIINALSATTTGLTVKISLTAVNNAFETSEGLANGSTSAEWIDLVATKSNWTISLINS